MSTDAGITELILNMDVIYTGDTVSEVRVTMPSARWVVLEGMFPGLVGSSIFGGAIWPVPSEDDRCAILWAQQQVAASGKVFLVESFWEYTMEGQLLHVWTAPPYEDEDGTGGGVPRYDPGRPVYLFPYRDRASGYSFWW